MKHSYQATCECARCAKEKARRQTQANTPHPAGCTCDRCYQAMRQQSRKRAKYARIAKRERAYADWAMNDDGPGDYEINGPDRD
jgi:hypothetical protein